MLRIYLFGHLRYYLDDQLQKYSVLPKTYPLWAYLLLHGGESMTRTRLAYLLWPDCSETDARANLRRHLHELRRILPAAEDTPWLLVDVNTVQWNPAADFWLDVHAFEELSASASPERLAAAVTLYGGDLLHDLFDDWIFFERERLRNRLLENLSLLIQHHHRSREYAQAIAYAQQLLQLDVMREDIVRELMMCRFEAGDRAGALQEYRRFEQRLREEMEVAPMVETRALYDSIAQHVLPAQPAPPVSAPLRAPAVTQETPDDRSPPGNLPAQLTSFVGREEEAAVLRNLLAGTGSGVRLLTLTGPGGSGKTRLALEAATRLRAERPELFPGGFFFVPLSTVTEVEAVLPLIAETLGIREQPGQPLLASVQDYLRPKRLLLLLDNFEHVMGAAPLALELLRYAPGLQIVATSRAVLHLYGEQEIPVAPLPLPELADRPSAEEIARCAAVTLFTTRSRAVNPSFVLNSENAGTIAEICVRLDGLPLAIELAAARSKLLSPRTLLERMTNRLAFLADRSRTAQERHQTLRTTLDWSYQLLNEDEKILFVRLAVFAGSFGLDAVEMVCNPDNRDVLGVLESLVDNSLVQQSALEADEFGVGAEPRFRLLSTIHEYASERFALAPEAERIRRRHLEYYLALAERSDMELRGANQGIWLVRMEQEHNDLRAALGWALEGDPEHRLLGLQLAVALGHFWYTDGHFIEGYRWLDRAYRQSGIGASPAVQAKALYSIGWLLHAQGDQRPVSFFEDSLALYRQLGDEQGMADAFYALGRLARGQGKLEQAENFLREGLALARKTGYAYRTGLLLNALASVYLSRKDFGRASPLYDEALATARRKKNKLTAAFILTAMGEMARLRNDYEQAEHHYQEAMALAIELRQRSRRMMLLHNLAYVALHRGETRRAVAFFGESGTLSLELPDRVNMGMCLIGLGSVAAVENDTLRAALYFGAGEMVLDTVGARLSPADEVEYRRYRALAEAQGDPQAVEKRVTQGCSLTLAEAQEMLLRR
jgi:predicted ATPase/DNA-binding SARP family transcriptional activator